MESSFESKFSALQADMVSICLEYCDRKAIEIFIHIIFERDSIFTNFFFRMNDGLHTKGMLGKSIGKISLNRQKAALSIITNNFKKIISVCEDSRKPVPKEMKLIYDVKGENFKAIYSYEPVTTNEKSAKTITEEWFNFNNVRILEG